MAKQLTTASIATGQTINAGHVTQSSVAFTGGEAYDITISGSLGITGSTSITGTLSLPGFPDVAASLTAADDGFPFSGSALITGSLIVTGSTNILASKGSNLTLEVNDSASFQFLTGAPNTGSFIIQTSPDKGLGFLQSYFGQGIAIAAGQPIPNQAFGITYTTGSAAANGELTMVIGKRDLSNLPGNSAVNDQNNFYVSFEPGGTFTNAQGELEFFVGEHGNVGSGVLSVFRSGPNATSQTSSFAGYFSSSAFPNQQLHTRPFAVSTILPVKNSNPAFVINKDITKLTSSSFSVDYGGNVTASGAISASGDVLGTNIVFTGNVSGSGTNSSYFGDEYNAHGGDANSGFTLLSLGSKPSIHASGASLKIGNTTNSTQTGIDLIGEVTASGNISASGDISGDKFISNNIQVVRHFNNTTFLGKAGTSTNIAGPITASIVSASGDIRGNTLRVGVTPDNTNGLFISASSFNGDTRDVQIIYPNHGLHFNSNTPNNHVLALAGNNVGVRMEPGGGAQALQVSGTIKVVDGHISASGHGIFQAGKPIKTHTANLTASLANAGLYHIVGGTLTCSVSISSAPIGAEYEFFQTQSGNFLFKSGSGITLISKDGNLKLVGQGSAATLKKVATSTFHLVGDLTS